MCINSIYKLSSKNTHNKISIVGKITDANSAVGIAGADIYLVANEFDGDNFIQYPITQIESGADGNYQITADVNNEVEFGIEVRKKDMKKHPTQPILNKEYLIQ